MDGNAYDFSDWLFVDAAVVEDLTILVCFGDFHANFIWNFPLIL